MSKTNKGYKPETLKKIVSGLKKEIENYSSDLLEGKTINIVISAGNSKIGKCMNVSLAPIITCGNCKECKGFCYDVKACLQYENVRKARAKNTAIFRNSMEDFFTQLWKKMAKKRTNKFLRFHVSGEITSIDHLQYMIKTAEMFPDFKIWTYTKMYWIVNQYVREHGGNRQECIPHNMSIMFSEWKGLPTNNDYDFPVFRCVMPEEEKPDCMKCPGNCDYCKAHNCGCIAGLSVYADLH